MLDYRKLFLGLQDLSYLMQYLLVVNFIDVLARDFIYDLLKATEDKFLDISTDHDQIVNKQTYLSWSLPGHIYIKKTLIKEFPTNVTVENIYSLDHDAVRILIDKNAVHFHISI